MKSGLPSSTASSRRKNALLTTGPCRGASETKLKTDKSCEPNEKGPQKISFNEGKKKGNKRPKRKKYQQQHRQQQEAIKQAAQARFGCTHLRPSFGSAKKKQQASKRFRNPRRKKASVSETLKGRKQALILFIFKILINKILWPPPPPPN
jgi:hypothetical protein